MSYYEDLGVSPDATDDEVLAAYRKRARETHPDKHPDDPEAADKFFVIARAWAALGDPGKRALHDKGLEFDEKTLYEEVASFVLETIVELDGDTTRDPLKLTKQKLRAAAEILEAQIVSNMKRIAAVSNTLERLTYRGPGNDELGHKLTLSIERDRRSIEGTKIEISRIETIIEMVDNYSFKVDEPPAPTFQRYTPGMISSLGAFNSGTGRW